MTVSICSPRPVLVPCGLENFRYQVDPYVGCGHCCHYCYVLSLAETDWTREILMHADIVGQLRAEIDGIPPQKLYLGYYTDPYQPCEADHRQTRKVLELLREKGFSASILTKSDLVLRDIDILADMNDAGVSISVAFNANKERGLFEAHTMDTEDRIAALRQIKEAGLGTGALVCPVIPYITDAFQLIDMLQPLADSIWVYGLSITDPDGENSRNTRRILNDHFPDLAARIEPVISEKDHPYWAELRERLEMVKEERGLNLNIRV